MQLTSLPEEDYLKGRLFSCRLNIYIKYLLYFNVYIKSKYRVLSLQDNKWTNISNENDWTYRWSNKPNFISTLLKVNYSWALLL